MAPPTEFLGRKIGRLTVIERMPDRLNTYGRPIRMWRCICDCGGETITSSSKLATTQSCGCYKVDRIRETKTTHGHKTRGQVSIEYNSWASMLARTTNPNFHNFGIWGGRGIDVDPRYIGRGGFEKFLADIGPRPSRKHTLDRIENDRGYWPGNIRWATAKQQSRNQRTTRFVVWKGQRISMRDAAEQEGYDPNLIGLRMKRGWTIERALTTPVRHVSRPTSRR